MAGNENRTARGGVLVVDKPTGWTSMDVCAKLRGVFHEKRVGHGGTLDPMATGVLPVFLGRATRAVEYVMEGEKEYIGAMRLGLTTDTQDITGTVLSQRPVPPAAAQQLQALLPEFTGELEQTPPMYSAVKVGGKKLYDLARKGVEVERKKRKITVHKLEMLSPDSLDPETRLKLLPDLLECPPNLPQNASALPENTAFFRVTVSKGTYIRTLFHDFGEKLGCGGCMSALRRTRVGNFKIEDAIDLNTLINAEDPWIFVRNVEDCFPQPSVSITGTALKRAKNGNPFLLAKPAGEYKIFDESGEFLLLGRCNGRECRVLKTFFEVEKP